MPTWKRVRLGGQKIQMVVLPSNSGEFEVGSKYGSSCEDGYLALLQGDTVCWYQRPSDPRSVGVSDAGDVVVGDWIKYGVSTGATISVWDKSHSRVYQDHIDVSAPTVGISADGNHIVICPYGEPARILDIRRNTEIIRHEYDISDRLVPNWITVGGEPQVEFRQKTGEDPLYRIDIDGNITWTSDSYEQLQYYQIVTLDYTIPWIDVIRDFATDYADTDDPELKNTIANTIGNARLVDANCNKLEEVVSSLTSVQSTFTEEEAHEKLVSQVLGEAYYRLAREFRSGVSVEDQFWQLINQSAMEYRTVLPWYKGKHGLSKTLRLQANQYAKQNRSGEALCCYEQIEALETRFDVSLLSTADKNQLEKYRQKTISATEPKETGQLIRQTQLSSYE